MLRPAMQTRALCIKARLYLTEVAAGSAPRNLPTVTPRQALSSCILIFSLIAFILLPIHRGTWSGFTNLVPTSGELPAVCHS